MTTPALPMGQSSSVTREVFRRGIRLDPMALLSLIRLRFDLMHDSRFTFNSQPQELWSMDRLVREESLLSAHFPCLGAFGEFTTTSATSNSLGSIITLAIK